MSGTALSEHFTDDEFRCRCGCGKVHVDPRLIYLLEKVRELIGRPLAVSSGFRCPEHNKAVGGKPNSAHLSGEAADIICAFGPDRFDLIRTLLTLGATRIGVGREFIHIDVSTVLPQRTIWLYGKVGS